MKLRYGRTMRMLTNADRLKRMCRLLNHRFDAMADFESVSVGASPTTGAEITVIN